MPSLIKTRRHMILGHVDEATLHAVFVQYDDDTKNPVEIRPTTVRLGMDDWRELGEPTDLTVTIEPGDLLNQEEA